MVCELYLNNAVRERTKEGREGGKDKKERKRERGRKKKSNNFIYITF